MARFEFGELVEHLGRCVPAVVERSSVAICEVRGTAPFQIGSGTLMAVAESRFLITAGHVVRPAANDGRSLVVQGASDGLFVATSGRWIVPPGDPAADSWDVAIYRFSDAEAGRFAHDAFVRIADASFEDDLSRKFFVVSGYPAMWSTVAADEGPMSSRLLQYGTSAFKGSVAGLAGFNSARHFLLDASPEYMVNRDAQPVSLRTLTNHGAHMPGDLRGVSGCSVWAIGDFRLPVEGWSASSARLVGLETSVYEGSRVIRATRWIAIVDLLREAFPELRNAIDMQV